MTKKELARIEWTAVFVEFAKRDPDDGDKRDFENKWRKTHEFYEEQKAYSNDPNLAHERPGIDDPKQRRSWDSLLAETIRDLRIRFPKEDNEN